MSTLHHLGLDADLRRRAAEVHRPDQRLARVTAVDRGRYLLRNEAGEVPGEITGRLRYAADSPQDLPCVGDWVCARYVDSDSRAVIQGLVPRKSALRRKTAGERIEFQVIAANLDGAFIVQSCHYDFNVRRLERYLVMVNEGRIEPLILLSKTDLVDAETFERMVASIRRLGGSLRVFAMSNVSGAGIDEIRQVLAPGKTYCLLGSSGVGKTTLINQLLDTEALETKTVSETGEGRHATTRRQLVLLKNGAMIVDTPGMRELGLLGGSEAVGESFADIRDLANRCRFANCTHTNEPGCALLAAVEDGTLGQDQYDDYLKLAREAEFHEMSYFDRRKKDKAFGRMVKEVKKRKQR